MEQETSHSHRRHSSQKMHSLYHKNSSHISHSTIEPSKIFDLINQVRASMKLTELRPNKTLSNVAQSIAYSKPYNLNFDGSGYSIVSMNTICKSVKTSNPEKLMKEWMLDYKYRSILLSPGNYAAIEVYPHEEGRKKITIVIASVFR
ncbi:hypothetical protein TRFO_12750 [Tritrichomonas foetus]|uniref:SCP domain-containing protein n=1 Tax=Tritrichomonas foetus TaxID=1144522 RepID=A0A1J4L0J9_9EUKA|nr:hypothetical protein TRFO_12750 [Tritrichomonas foetus]|eukprot:OHT17041.1 hypothetical protein TRFO_12750 [Tritrichomonas foetus]